MTDGRDWATTSAVIPRMLWTASVTGNLVVPASTLFQTPPLSVPTYAIAGWPSTPATESILPAMNGPMLRHCMPLKRVGLTCACVVPAKNSIAAATAPRLNLFMRLVVVSEVTLTPLENSETQACCQRGADLFATSEVRRADLLGSRDLLRRLRVRADDDRSGDRAQPPARGDALDLAGSVGAVAAGADESGVGAALDMVECAIVAAVKEILHETGHRREILGTGKKIAVALEQSLRFRRRRGRQAHGDCRLARGGSCRGAGHLLRAAGDGVIHDQQSLHPLARIPNETSRSSHFSQELPDSRCVVIASSHQLLSPPILPRVVLEGSLGNELNGLSTIADIGEERLVQRAEGRARRQLVPAYPSLHGTPGGDHRRCDLTSPGRARDLVLLILIGQPTRSVDNLGLLGSEPQDIDAKRHLGGGKMRAPGQRPGR